jgi:anion-transporting  ArsA/GET3 family ATPase
MGRLSNKRLLIVCEVNTDERISSLLGRPAVGTEIGSLEQNLWAVDVRPAEAMREYALMILKFEAIYNAVFENRLVRHFLRFLPSIQELVILGKILFHLREKERDGSWRFDVIVVDAPATGHALSFLSVPQVLLDTVPAGALQKEAKMMRDLLVDPAVTAAVLVSLPEEMPVNETIELAQALESKVKVVPQLVVLNHFIEGRFTPDDLTALAGDSPRLLELARAHFNREQLSLDSKARLERGVKAELVTVPRLFHPSFGRKSIEAIGRAVGPLLDPGPR